MRTLRHLFAASAQATYPEESLQRIADAVVASELRHRGEICFAVESALPLRDLLTERPARDRAQEVFARLRVWDTEANNGVLVYLLLADHRIEIIADRGFKGRVSAEQWREVCHLMEERLRAGAAEQAAMAGVNAISELITTHFPRTPGDNDRDELPNRPHIL